MTNSVTSLHAMKYVVACKSNQSSKKIFQIGFAKSDNSIFISLPYFESCTGIVGVATLDPGRLSKPYKLAENFLSTNHSVKYSHHPSGRAHFSLTGKVKSSVGKQSVPLDRASGHIFTVMTQDLSKFEDLSDRDVKKKDRIVIPYRVNSDEISALKFVGHIWQERELATRIIGHRGESPWLRLISTDGIIRQGILMSTPIFSNGRRSYLAMTLEHVPSVNKDKSFSAIILGGFDERAIALDYSRETSVLIAVYPAPKPDDSIVRQSIDFAT